jgi:hypothetical protein
LFQAVLAGKLFNVEIAKLVTVSLLRSSGVFRAVANKSLAPTGPDNRARISRIDFPRSRPFLLSQRRVSAQVFAVAEEGTCGIRYDVRRRPGNTAERELATAAVHR